MLRMEVRYRNMKDKQRMIARVCEWKQPINGILKSKYCSKKPIGTVSNHSSQFGQCIVSM